MLKLRKRYHQNKNEQLKQYITKALHKAMLTWIKTEPNLRQEIIEQINKEINSIEQIEEKDWKQLVNNQAFLRLFTNDIPEQVKSKINKL